MNALGRDIEVGEVVLIDPDGMNPGLTDFELLLRTKNGFGLNHQLRGTAVTGVWVDGTEPQGIRRDGYDILCSCRSETWQCPSCGKFSEVWFKNADGKVRLGEVVKGQACACGRGFEENAWTCAAPLED